jgi:hypothetical protein
MMMMMMMVCPVVKNLLNDQVNIYASAALCVLVDNKSMIPAQCTFLDITMPLIKLTLSSADCVVSLDACFTQKRRHGPVDPYHQHPQSVFLTDAEIKTMEHLVDEQRPSRPRTVDPNVDEFEPSMKVPNSVLDDCGNSFKAADELRVKASTQFFADTGLMALLCRHDRVLWLVNMTSPGERQHYALALLNKLFEHLPLSVRVGVLYDIGCQLHRSCVKWGFLSQFLDRITFGISVFHAYGHQWPCQLIYHPRKCLGFGLTDGEGCERFWSALKQLIPSLRVAGVSYRILLVFSSANISVVLPPTVYHQLSSSVFGRSVPL